MSIARLDNEVFFKKAFTDPVVFRAFVRDIVGIDVNPAIIETEKAFQPKAGNVAFKYDIFAEDTQKRVIIEIQKVDYDYNFDRFLHYHLQAITEQQRRAEDYSIERTVYTIVVITAPYKLDKQTGEVLRDDVLISRLNPRNLRGVERDLFGHTLIYLNPNYADSTTPANYRDWLTLIWESIHNADNPQVNLMNEGIRRATELVQWDNLTPEEWEASKVEAGRRKVLVLKYEEGVEEGAARKARQAAQNLLRLGKLTVAEIAELLEISTEIVEEIRAEMNT